MIFIPYSVPSSKNGRRSFGRYNIASDATMKYRSITEAIYRDNTAIFNNLLGENKKPYIIGLHFVRASKHKFDFNNCNQTIADIIKKDKKKNWFWVEEDNMDEVIFVPFEIDGKLYSYNKENPGVYIKVFNKMILE